MINKALVRRRCIDHILKGCSDIIKLRKNLEEMSAEEEEFHLTTRDQYIAQTVFSKIMNELEDEADPYV